MIRGEEHLSNTPKQQLLWEALGHEPPAWGHLPVLVNEKRQKLSKRRDKVALEDFRDEGYLAAAMRNYLMLLGWAPRGDREIVPWEEMVAEFRIEDVNPSPAFFDVKKLRAFNGEYIRALPAEEFIAAVPAVARRRPARRGRRSGSTRRCSPSSRRWRRPGSRCWRRSRRWSTSRSCAEPAVDEASWAKAMREPAADLLAEVAAAYEDVPWQPDALRERLEAIGATFGLSLGKAQAPVRVAVTGRTVGLPLFESLTVLGRTGDPAPHRVGARASHRAGLATHRRVIARRVGSQVGSSLNTNLVSSMVVSIQIAVRLPDSTVEQLDKLVAAGQARSRASVIERALAREFRRLIAAKDAAILAEAGPDADMDSLAGYAARTAAGYRVAMRPIHAARLDKARPVLVLTRELVRPHWTA